MALALQENLTVSVATSLHSSLHLLLRVFQTTSNSNFFQIYIFREIHLHHI